MNVLASLLLLACTPSSVDVKGDDTALDSGASASVDTDGDSGSVTEDCEDGDPTAWFQDADDDGHGNPDVSQTACDAPEGFVDNDTDCDDDDPTIHPDATEICDPDGATLDNDCDGLVDLEDPSIDPATASVWFVDGDGDGFGDPDSAVVACAQPSDGTDDYTDCDDADPAVHPGAEEVCDGVDNDCDGSGDGEIRFTAVTSTYAYAGTETLSELQDEVNASPLLCTTPLTSTDVFSGPETCGSGTSDIAYELSLTLSVTAATAGTWSFRLGPDFGSGGAMFVDEVALDHSVDDLWWNYSWDNPAELLQVEVQLTPGDHTLNAIGFEGCCSGYSAFQVSLPGAEWATATSGDTWLGCAE